ncbi:MAG: hypothetical protein Q8S35_01170 [bacterium]|nr:hypothetical protein [bacterium]
MGFEGKHHAPLPEVESKMRETMRDRIFDQLVAARVLDTFLDELDECDFKESDLEEITSAFGELPEADKRAVLAIPAQLRPQVFKRYASMIHDGTISGRGMIDDVLEKARKYGFTLGFHLSPIDIRPGKDGSWMIKGTEKDHRHDDRAMAYYSTDYSHRYLKKPSRYLYVVRAETGEDTSHYPDNDGSWGHASSLAIIEQVDMPALEKEMETRLKAIEDRKDSSKGDA